MAGIRIAGMGSHLGARKVPSKTLARKIRVEEGWIESRTGIGSRFFCGRVQRGHKILLASFGAGYSWGAALFAY